MCKWRPKVRNGQNLPHESPNFTNYLKKVILLTILALFPQVWHQITKTVFSKLFFLFSILNSKMSLNMCIRRHKLWNDKTGVGPTFTWSNEPWSIRVPSIWGIQKQQTFNDTPATQNLRPTTRFQPRYLREAFQNKNLKCNLFFPNWYWPPPPPPSKSKLFEIYFWFFCWFNQM